MLRSFKESLQGSPLRLRLARGAFWSLAGTLAARALGLGVSIFVARILGRTGYGEFGIFQATVGMFAAFAAFGLGLTATKYVGELRLQDPARAGRIIGLSNGVAWVTGTLMSSLLFILAPWLAAHALAAPRLDTILRIGSPLLLLAAIDGAQTGALAGFEAFRLMARVSLLGGALSLPLVVGGASWLGLKGAVAGLVASQTITCLLNKRALVVEAASLGGRARWPTAIQEWRVLLDFSLPAVASSLLVGPVYWLCTAILVNQPDGYAEMGLFNAANQWFGALLFLPGVLGQAALPILSEQVGRKNDSEVRRILRFYVGLNGLVVLPLVLGGTLASPYIMGWYGPSFSEAWSTLAVVLVTAGLLAVLNPVGQVIAALGRMWLGASMNFGWAICFVALTGLLVTWGALGLASARLGAYAVHAAWTIAFARLLLRDKARSPLEKEGLTH